jgi:hypothetical protein
MYEANIFNKNPGPKAGSQHEDLPKPSLSGFQISEGQIWRIKGKKRYDI